MTSQASVRSTFNYTRDTGVTPEIYFYEPLPGSETHRPGDDPREMTVHDGWDRAKSFSLNREGFALREFHSSFEDWDNDDAIKARFYGEVSEFVRRGSAPSAWSCSTTPSAPSPMSAADE